MAELTKLTALVERKHPKLPCFVVVPTTYVAGWRLTGTTTVAAAVNDCGIGRRSLKKILELTEPICQRAHIDTGDQNGPHASSLR